MVLKQSFVLHVTIASPGDMIPTRRVIFDHIESFNRTFADDLGFILKQNSWEHAVAASGAFPQQELNKQIIARANIMVAMFKDKFGSPTTAGYNSGTEEEIELFFSKGGRPAVYFRNDLSSLATNNLLSLTDFEQSLLSVAGQAELEKAKQLKLVRDYQQKLYGREFLVSDYIPAAAGEVDHQMVMRAMEAIQHQAKELVKQSSKSPEDKKIIQTSLNKLTKKTPTPKSSQSEIISPSSGSIGLGATVTRNVDGWKSVYGSANAGRIEAKIVRSSPASKHPVKPLNNDSHQGLEVWTPPKNLNLAQPKNRFERALTGEEPVFVSHDNTILKYTKLNSATNNLHVTLGYGSDVWLIRNSSEHSISVDHVDILLRKSEASLSKRIGLLREEFEKVESFTSLPIKIPSGVQRRDAMRVEFRIYYQSHDGELLQERIPVRLLNVNEVPTKDSTPNSKQSGTTSTGSDYLKKSGGSQYEIIGPKSGIIGRDAKVSKSSGSSRTVSGSAKSGSFVSKSAKTSLSSKESMESSIDRQLNSKKRGQGKVAWTPSQRPSDDPLMQQFERAFAGEEPVFIDRDGSGRSYTQTAFETGKIKVTLDYASGVWHIRNTGEYNLRVDHVDIVLKRNPEASLSKKIGILRELNETLESLTTLPIEIPSGVQRRDAMRVEFRIYYQNPTGGLVQERVPVKPLNLS